MRNLTKVLAMVLAFTMMVSVAVFAIDYTDVEAGANYAEAVDVLSDLGLVKGYEDGTFGADKTLTRAEAATLVVRLMGLEDAAVAAAGSATGFTDVAADHWASGYIYIAAQKGVVAGMGDGTFEPDTTLEYAQIVKMIVVALGYAPQAAEAGEWPGNYISTASNIGLTKGIAGKATDAASRGLTARLLYASLTIPKMEKSGVGVNAIFEPVDKMILDELALVKLQAKVTAVDTIEGTATISDDWKQALIINKKYKETNDEDYVTYDEDATVNVGVLAADLKALQNVPAYIYLAEDDGEYVVASIVAKKNVSTVSFTSEDYDEYDSAKRKLTVYTNAEQTKTLSVKLAANIDVYINGESYDDDMTAADFDTFVEDGAYVIDLMDTDNDGEYDYASATFFQYMVVAEAKTNKQGVCSIEGEILTIADEIEMPDFKIDTENEDTDITIIKDGEVVDVDAIEEGDILNVVVVEYIARTKELVQGTIYVTNDKVDATVRYVDDEEGIIVMTDGNSYKALITDELASQTEATFFLSISGKVIYMDDEVTKSSYELAFANNIVLTGKNDVMKTGTIRVLTTEGEWKTLDLKTTFTFNGSSVKIADVDPDEFADEFVAYAADTREPEFYILNMVEYKLDSTGAVKAINVLSSAREEDSFGYADEYKNDGEEAVFGAYIFDETTVVYNVSADATLDETFEEKDITVTDISILKDGNDYTADLYDINEKTDLVSVIKGTFSADVDFEAPLFVLKSIVEENIEDEDVIVLIGFENGEEKTYYVSQDKDSEVLVVASDDDTVVTGAALEDMYEAASYAHGDIFIVNADANGYIAKAVKMGSVYNFIATDDDDNTSFIMPADIFGDAIEGDDEGFVVTGLVVAMNGKKTSVYLDTDDTDLIAGEVAVTGLDNVVIKKAETVTVFDATAKKANRISAGSAKDIEVGTMLIGRVDKNDNLVEGIVIITDATDNY